MKISSINWNIGKLKLNGVYLSHLHADHIAGVRELPKNIPYIVGKGEIEQYRPEIYGDFLKDVETIYELDFSKLDEIPPLGHMCRPIRRWIYLGCFNSRAH